MTSEQLLADPDFRLDLAHPNRSATLRRGRRFGEARARLHDARVEAKTERTNDSFRKSRVLIADDEPRIRLALRACLEADGCEVLEAATGMEALDLIVREAPDLMVLDLQMPDVDGMQTLAHIEGVHGQLKPRTIVLTAWASPPAAARAIGLGAAAFVEKPIDPDSLRRIVRKVLAESTGPQDGGIEIDWPGNDDEGTPDEPGQRQAFARDERADQPTPNRSRLPLMNEDPMFRLAGGWIWRTRAIQLTPTIWNDGATSPEAIP